MLRSQLSHLMHTNLWLLRITSCCLLCLLSKCVLVVCFCYEFCFYHLFCFSLPLNSYLCIFIFLLSLGSQLVCSSYVFLCGAKIMNKMRKLALYSSYTFAYMLKLNKCLIIVHDFIQTYNYILLQTYNYILLLCHLKVLLCAT